MNKKRQNGVALITVLWLVTLLVLLGTVASALSVATKRAIQRQAEAIKADNDIDSQIRLALLIAAEGVQTKNTTTDDIGSNIILESIVPETGLIDINFASKSLLFAYFVTQGWSEPDAENIVAKIIDWRDGDDALTLGGAETSDYQMNGLFYGSRNGPFEAVEEIRLVYGLGGLSGTVLAGLTVHSQQQLPNYTFATPSVLNAAQWAERRGLDGQSWLGSEMTHMNEENDRSGGSSARKNSGVVRVRACETYGRCRVATVRLTATSTRLMQVFAWQTDAWP